MIKSEWSQSYRTRANFKGLVLSGSHNLGCCKVCSHLQILQCLKEVCDIAWVGVRRVTFPALLENYTSEEFSCRLLHMTDTLRPVGVWGNVF